MKKTDIDYLLNVLLNEAMISPRRIKGMPDSNKIAQFVIDYLEQNPDTINLIIKT